jgi:hypothetical protein
VSNRNGLRLAVVCAVLQVVASLAPVFEASTMLREVCRPIERARQQKGVA